MLHSIAEMETVAITATDGILGAPRDFYFDDAAWVIRYLVVETGWIPRHRVLISPLYMDRLNWSERILPVSLTQQQVKDSPDIDTDQPHTQDHDYVHLRSGNSVTHGPDEKRACA